MEKGRGVLDICNDINDIFESYERDKKYIDYKKISVLKEELFTTLNKKKNKKEPVDNSFICLTQHLYKAINDDINIDWEHIGIYNDIYQTIESLFPNIGNKSITNTTYKELNKSNILIKSNRKH